LGLCEGLCVLSFGVDLCDEDVGLVDEVVGECLPNWSEGLAVYIIASVAVSGTYRKGDVRPHQGAVNATRTS
jgi:hypothetical protein